MMEGKLKTPVRGAVPKSLGRQIGVLPVGNPPPRARRPGPRQVLPPAGETVPGDTNLRSLSGSTSSKRASYQSRVKRTLSDRSLSGNSTSKSYINKYVPCPPVGENDRSSKCSSAADSESDIVFTDVPRSARSVTSVDTNISEIDINNVQKKKKIISEEDILAQNQETDLSKIYEINLNAAELTHISNLEKFQSLRVLDLSCNYIEKIEKLDHNKDLRELKLYDNQLTVIENLKNLKELCSLQLQYNKLKHIGKGLSALTKLKTIRLDCNRFLRLEVSELSCCVQLTSVNVSYNMLDSLSALNYLPNVEEIYASGNRLRQLEINRCKKLQDLDVSKNKITDLSGIKGMPNLQTLNISSNHVTSLKTLGKSKTLQEIHASENKISELSFFPSFYPRLEILNVSCNNIKDFDEVLALENLEDFAELFIYGNPFCAPGAKYTHYMGEVQSTLTQLEILDGAHIKRQTHKGAPLMRPMSASTIVSVRQVETQMKAADNELESFEKSIMDKFDSLRAICAMLPTDLPSSSNKDTDTSVLQHMPGSKPSSRSGSRARIKEALSFAADNFDI